MLRRNLSTLALSAAVAAGLTAPAHASTNGVQFGALVAPKHGETFATAQDRADAAYGQMPISRVFYNGAVKPWAGNAGVSGRPVVVSFQYAPVSVTDGTYDAAIRTFFADAPSGYDVYWSYFHEPEDNVGRLEFTAAQYTAAWRHIAAIAAGAAPTKTNLHSTLILQCYTMNPASGRDWRDYYVPVAQSMLAFDCYNHAGKRNRYGDPANIFKPVTTWSAANPDIPWGIAEVGSTLGISDTTGSLRAAWLRNVGSFLTAQHARPTSAVFGIYFDTVGPSGTDYRLTDSASQLAWRDVVQNY